MDIELAQALKEIADAKEIIKNLLNEFERMDVLCNYQLRTQAEQFLIAPEDRFEVTKKGKEYLSSH